MRSLALAVIVASAGCASPPKADAPAPAGPTGRAVGRSSWNTLSPGARVKVATKKGTFVGGFILYHDLVLWVNVDGAGRKAFDALSVVRLSVIEAQ